MQKKINQLENHYIICGYGRMGTKIAQELKKRKKPFVVLEKELDNPGSETMIEKNDNLIVIGEREKLDKLQEKANEN
jgi:voltage-gated potassium channel